MAGAAEPLEGPGIDITIGLWLMVAVCLGIALLRIWNYTIGAVLALLARSLHVSVWRVHINLGGPFDAANRYLQEALGRWVLANEKALGIWWHANKQVASYLGDSLVDFASASHFSFHSLIFGTIPSAISDSVAPVKHGVATVTRVVQHTTTRIETRIYHVARAQALELEREFGKAWRGIDYIRDVAIPRLWRVERGIAADVGRLERTVGRAIPRRLTALEKALGASALAGTAIYALTRVFPFWQCSSVKRFNRQLCRSPLGSLDWLLADVFEAILVSDLCDFVATVGTAAKGVQPLLLAFVEAEDVLIGCRGATKPNALPLPGWQGVPPTGGVSVSL